MSYTRLIHRFWDGSEIPEQYKAYGRRWEELNPGWEVIDWNLNALPYIRPDIQEIFEDLYRQDAGRYGIELYVQLADVLGYYLVYMYGGIYTNCDIEPLKPIEEILPDKAWASYENDEDGRIVNAIIGAPQPGDPFWYELLAGLRDNYFVNPEDEMVLTTGPGYLTLKAMTNRDKIHVFGVNTFNPVHWKQIADGGDATGFTYPEESYGVHHWGHKKLNSLGQMRSNKVATATQID